MFIITIVKALGNVTISLRDRLWNYPEYLFARENSPWQVFKRFYQSSVPVSHFVFVSFIILLSAVLVLENAKAFLNHHDESFTEGIVMGVDSNGDLQQINRINPLINTNIQLEKDLNEIIYESLIDIDTTGNPTPVLGDFLKIEEGRIYQFKLKDNLYWQDGMPITSEDVAKTFELLQSLESDPKTSTLYSRAAIKMDFEKKDDKSFEFKLKGENTYIPELAFFEAISFKILPAHLLSDMNVYNIGSSDPYLNRNPLGSGPYKFTSIRDDTITLTRFDKYHGAMPKITTLKFKLFNDDDAALSALKTGQIHALTGLNTNSLREVSTLPNLQTIKSNVIYNQYFALYFNLGDNGPAPLKEEKVRQAIASAIDKDKIVETILGFGEVAYGPIPKNSFAFSSAGVFSFDKERVDRLLNEAGWIIPAGKKVREKDGQVLSFNLVLVNNPDRQLIAEVIQKQLQDVGIEINLVYKDLETVINENIIPRVFDIILYGVQTFIDPDRYEFFHSSQIALPGLNISSYASDDKKLTVVGNKTVKVPTVDDDLNSARKIVNQQLRAKKYQDFQRIIAQEVPAVFLFHPIEAYVVNKRVKNIKLDSIKSLEHRFDNIADWVINVD